MFGKFSDKEDWNVVVDDGGGSQYDLGISVDIEKERGGIGDPVVMYTRNDTPSAVIPSKSSRSRYVPFFLDCGIRSDS